MLDLRAITKRYGAVVALDNVSLAAADGEFVVLLGPSGCGKSTLLRIVAGLEIPDEGTVGLAGRDITALPPRDRDLAMVFQNYALYPHMTVAQNIEYPLKIRRRAPQQTAVEVAAVAEKLGLSGLLDRLPRELSGGQRQRVAFARAIIRQPKAFLMDEPLSNLDAQLRMATRAELKRLQHELRIVTLYVTHDQAEAMTLAHRIAVMQAGRIVQCDTPANIYHRPSNTFVAAFVGSPPMNLIEGGLGTLTRPNGATTLGVRPEDVEISTTEQPGWQPASVYVAEEMGNETVVRAAVGKTFITARVSPDTRLRFEDRVWLRLRPEKLNWFDAGGTRLPPTESCSGPPLPNPPGSRSG
jgi:multiple sugar transport system ATP-binding protein